MRRRLLLAACLLPGLAACADRYSSLDGQPVRAVYFTPDSAALDDSALAVVDDAATLANRHQTAPVSVLGYADTDGSNATNHALSETRARVVVDRLVARGVQPARIAVRGRGPTSFELAPVESRRVEIRVGS